MSTTPNKSSAGEAKATSHPIMLCTGRLALHRRIPNGAQEVYFEDGKHMTEREWQDYCDKARARAWKAGHVFVKAS